MIAVKRVDQAVLQHGVDEFDVSHLGPRAHMRGMGAQRHRFLVTRDDHVGIAIVDLLHAQRHSAQSRTTNLIKDPRGIFLGNAGCHRGLPAGILSLRGCEHLA